MRGMEQGTCQENARLWMPPKQRRHVSATPKTLPARPMFDRSEINISRVPLGTIVQAFAL